MNNIAPTVPPPPIQSVEGDGDDGLARRCVVLVLSAEDETMIDEIANKLADAMKIAGENTELPEGIEIDEIFVENPDAPDEEVDEQ